MAGKTAQVQSDMEADVDDLRGTIAAAIEAANVPETIESEPVKQDSSPKSSAPAPEPASSTPPQDSEVPASLKAGAETTEAQPENAEGAEQVAADKTDKPEGPIPSNWGRWSRADKERFLEQPEGARKFLIDRLQSIEADYTKKTMKIAELDREYTPVAEMFAPFAQQLRQMGRTPSSIIRDWANAEAALSNPATRDNAVLTIAKSYGVDLAKLAGFQATQPQPQIDPANMTEQQQLDALLNPYIKQALTPYQQEMENLKQQLAQAQQFQTNAVRGQQQQVLQSVVNEVEAFANATDSQGNHLHPYFRDVENDMATIAAGLMQWGRPVPSMEELYQQAVRANPSTYERLTAQQKIAAEAARTQEARAKSAKAQKAGSSVTGAPGSGQPFVHTNGDGRNLSLRDELRAAIEASRA